MAAPRMSATSRDPEEYARATKAARETRAAVAREVAGVIAKQVEELIIEGDIMGGRALVAQRIQQVLVAEKRGDPDVLRASVMDGAAAFGLWVAALDWRPPAQLDGA